MQENIGVPVKFSRAFFKKDNRENIPDIPVAEGFLLLAAHALVLAQQQICRVAGAALAGEGIADFLHFDVGDTAVFQLRHNIRDQKG